MGDPFRAVNARRVFVTGATGYIGRALSAALLARGDQVVALSRGAARAAAALGDSPRLTVVEGDPTEAGAWCAAVAGCDAVVNLAGEPLSAHRWNAQVRQILHDSRVDTTRQLVAAIAAAPEGAQPRVLVSASGIDYYSFDEVVGDDSDEVDERAPAGTSFLARLCRDWEAEARAAEPLGVRVVLMRAGVVVGGQGGQIERWARAFRWFVGGRIGSGRQWMSWVHLEDVVGAYLLALDRDSLAGPVNLVSPNRLRNRDFARELAGSLHRPSILPTPAPAVRLAIGEFAEYLLHGRPAVPRALEAAGYVFRRSRPFTSS